MGRFFKVEGYQVELSDHGAALYEAGRHRHWTFAEAEEAESERRRAIEQKYGNNSKRAPISLLERT